VRDATGLATRLPDRPYMLNLCGDRYGFAVGFAAALLRGQVSLLPPNYTVDFVARLNAAYPGAYCLTDGAHGYQGMEAVVLADLLAAARAAGDAVDKAAVPRIPAAQCAALVFTSGSTGDPVAHEKSWGGLVADGTAEAAQLGIAPDSGFALLGTVPPQHMYGLETTVLMPLLAGLALVAEKPFYPADIRAGLAALPAPRGLVTTPVHLRTLLADHAPLPAADIVVCATAPLAQETAQQAEARFAAPLFEIYGCTEAGQVATRRTAQSASWRLFPGIGLERGPDGRTWVQGAHVEVAAPLGDVIEQHPDGTFLLLGRTSDMVNIGGKRTSLQSLNHHLNAIDGVRDGIFVLPDEGDANRTMAFAVAPSLSEAVILAALRTRMDPVFLPRPLVLLDALPRNSTGKITREAVRQLIARHVEGRLAKQAAQ
jgi:acyl-coenzyme A synthetase/AMP-(fatty) acid ligase